MSENERKPENDEENKGTNPKPPQQPGQPKPGQPSPQGGDR